VWPTACANGFTCTPHQARPQHQNTALERTSFSLCPPPPMPFLHCQPYKRPTAALQHTDTLCNTPCATHPVQHTLCNTPCATHPVHAPSCSALHISNPPPKTPATDTKEGMQQTCDASVTTTHWECDPPHTHMSHMLTSDKHHHGQHAGCRGGAPPAPHTYTRALHCDTNLEAHTRYTTDDAPPQHATEHPSTLKKCPQTPTTHTHHTRNLNPFDVQPS
jgi:hypothetical protein